MWVFVLYREVFPLFSEQQFHSCYFLPANPNVCSTSSSHEVTPLHVAAGLGHLACLQLLVQSGGDVLYPDNQHRTPLDYAVLNGQELCLNYLNEEIGKEPNPTTHHTPP